MPTYKVIAREASFKAYYVDADTADDIDLTNIENQSGKEVDYEFDIVAVEPINLQR